MMTRIWVRSGVAVLAIAALTAGAAAQDARGERGARGAQGGERGRGRGAAPTLPPLLFREVWKRPPYTGELNDENRKITQEAVTAPNLELKLYGTDASKIL